MITRARWLSMIFLALALSPLLARAEGEAIVLGFDNEGSVADWQFEFGGAAHTEKFSKDDATGKADSGSLEVELTYPAMDDEHKGAYTYRFADPGLDATQYASLECDLKVVKGSAMDSMGDNGYLTIALRNAGNDWSDQFSDSIRVSDDWRHISTPLSSDVNDIRAITFQLWGGPEQNINGAVTLRLDNVKLVRKASAAK